MAGPDDKTREMNATKPPTKSTSLLVCWWFNPGVVVCLGGCLVAWLVCSLAGWLADRVFGYLVRGWWSCRLVCWLLVGSFGRLAGLAQPANAWPQAQGPSQRGKREGAMPTVEFKTIQQLPQAPVGDGFKILNRPDGGGVGEVEAFGSIDNIDNSDIVVLL